MSARRFTSLVSVSAGLVKILDILLLIRQDIDGALAALKECKEAGLYATNGTCFLLLNTMAKTGKTEHFEEGESHFLSTY